MKVKYELEGMSCRGCVNNVKRALLQLPDVTEAEVQLHPPGVIITLNTFIDVDELQAELSKAGQYTIRELVPQ